ncbi:hypothetical protein DPMN_139382 [Dreissena polymorpha]|uniref:Uncharacterized protein n=1 Tax=Dreissena polymorpha TaxID=45954 RepID=A0A9D4JKQ9_DREPO|nr:hypothetical protein DPMN_139367 [Dreissena polymorpha]KAH3810982.1 hypothetical protein DPMN_139382 [Dreissena polymorpha]
MYLTKMGPDSSLKKLQVNNYDNDVSKAKMKKLIKERGSKAEVCFGQNFQTMSMRTSLNNVMPREEMCTSSRALFSYRIWMT